MFLLQTYLYACYCSTCLPFKVVVLKAAQVLGQRQGTPRTHRKARPTEGPQGVDNESHGFGFG